MKKLFTIIILFSCVWVSVFAQVGAFDTSFGSAGAYTFPRPQGINWVTGNNLIVLPNDQILVQTAEEKSSSFVANGKLTKLSAGGVLDVAFGSNGSILIDDSLFSTGLDFIKMPNGNIASLWVKSVQSTSVLDDIPFITLHNVNGAPIFSFGSNGIVNMPPSPTGGVVGGMLVSDGNNNLYVLYAFNGGMAIRSYTSTGSINNAFGNGGELLLPNVDYAQLAYTSVAGGRLLLVSNVNGTIEVKQLLMTGQTDFGYGSAGITMIPTSVALGEFELSQIEIQNDGKLLIHFTEFSQSQLVVGVARVGTNGIIDIPFNNNAKINYNLLSDTVFVGNRLVQQPDGKILISGANYDIDTEIAQKAFLRLNADGTFDNTFGINGLLSLGGWAAEYVSDVALQSTGKIIGLVDGGDIETAAYVIRLLNNLSIGILPHNAVNELGVYPNPINHQFELSYELNSSEAISIDLIDGQGRTVYNFQTKRQENGKQTHLFVLPNIITTGIYTLVISSDKGSKSYLQIVVSN